MESFALRDAIAGFNDENFTRAINAVKRINEPQAQVSKAIIALWLAGRLEVEAEGTLARAALKILRDYVPARRHSPPDDPAG